MLFIATLVFVSCQNEDMLDAEAISTEKYPEIALKLQKMYFNTDDLKLINHTLPDGTKEKVFEVEGIFYLQESI